MPKYQDGYPLDVAVYLSESPSFPLRKCALQRRLGP